MKRLTKASKIGLAALLVAITFFALTIFFTVYQPEVDSAVNTLENAILKDNSPVENELVAEAATVVSRTIYINQPKTTIDLRPNKSDGKSRTNLNYQNTGLDWSDTYTVSTNSDGTYKWTFGSKTGYVAQGSRASKYSVVYMDMDLGSYVGTMCSRSIAYISFSCKFSKGDSLDSGCFNVDSSSTAFSDASADNIYSWATGSHMFSNTQNSQKSFSNKVKLNGRYVRIVLAAKDVSNRVGTGNWDHVTLDSMKMTIEISDTTAPTLGSLTQSSGTIGVSDSGTGVWKYTISGTRLDGASKSGTFYFVDSGQTAASGTINLKTLDSNTYGYGKYTITLYDGNNNTTKKSYTYYQTSISTSLVTHGGGTGGTISVSKSSGLSENESVTVTITANKGYFFAGIYYDTASDTGKTIFSSTYSYTVPYKNVSSLSIVAHFVSFSVAANDSVYSFGKSVAATASQGTLENSSPPPYKLNDGIAFEISYSGTLAGGGSWDSVPQYAGEYTATAYAKYGDTTVGTTSCSYTITPMTVYAAPVFDSASKTYDGKTTFAISGWRLYSDSQRNSYIADTSNDLIKVSGPASYSVTGKDQGNYTFSIPASGISLKSSSTTDTAAKTGSYKLDTGDITKYYLSGSTGNAASNSSLFIIAKQITPTLFLAEMTANGAEKYTGKVYDNSNDILGNDFVLFIYDGTVDGALAAFEAASPAVGVIGLGLNIKGMVSGETYAFKLDGASTGSATLVLTFNASPVYPNYEYTDTEVSAGVARSDITLDSSNYTFSLDLSVAGLKISPRPLTVSLTSVSDKDYDGTRAAGVEYALSGIASGDSITLTGGSASFEDENAGENKTVTFSGYSVGGDKNYNYYLVNESVSGTAIIRKVKASWEADYLGKVTDEEAGKEVKGKLFDGTTAVDSLLLSFKVKGAVNDETFAILVPEYAASFTSSAAGETTIKITAESLSGNYDFENDAFVIIGLNIVRKSIGSEGVTFALNKTEFVYTSSVCAPVLTEAVDENIAALVEGDDYIVSIPSSVTVGSYTVSLEGDGNYFGSLSLTYKITAGTFTATLGETAEIVLDYGTILATDEVETYFPSVAASNDASKANIADGTWEFVIPSDIYNAKGNTGLYRATHDTPHVIKAVYTLPDSEKPNYESESAEIEIALSVTRGALHITILPETVTFGSTYSLGAVSGTDYTISGFVEGDESNLSGVKFALKDAEGFVAARDTLNNVGTYPNAITLSAYESYNDNYTVEADFGTLEINPLPVTVAPDTDQFKYYGESDPVFDYTATTVYPLRADYSIDYSEFTGAVSRTEGEIATNYAFVQGTLASENYSLTFKPDSNTVFSIKVLPVTVKAVNREAYYGTLISSPTEYTVSVDGEYKVDYTFENGVMSFRIGDTVMTDALSVSLNTSANDSAAASAYPISVSLATSSGLNSSKNLSISTLDAVYTILKLPVLITPNAIEKTYGSSDPAHTSFTNLEQTSILRSTATSYARRAKTWEYTPGNRERSPLPTLTTKTSLSALTLTPTTRSR